MTTTTALTVDLSSEQPLSQKRMTTTTALTVDLSSEQHLNQKRMTRITMLRVTVLLRLLYIYS